MTPIQKIKLKFLGVVKEFIAIMSRSYKNPIIQKMIKILFIFLVVVLALYIIGWIIYMESPSQELFSGLTKLLILYAILAIVIFAIMVTYTELSRRANKADLEVLERYKLKINEELDEAMMKKESDQNAR
jgi:glucan phosphoethanolaminetransferase (alkaline phosphatase superfamily)